MDLNIGQMMEMQLELYEKYKDRWEPLEPFNARNQLLWGIGEIGEMIDIIKKHKDESIAPGGAMREEFAKETTDVLMYLLDVLLCYGFTADEFSRIYAAKHAHNMKRKYVGTDYDEEDRKNGEEADH